MPKEDLAVLKAKKRLPEWIRVKVNRGKNRREINKILKERKLFTVCEEAKCPNLADCWHRGTATFMLMGSNCTRACRFCAIGYEKPSPLDPNEPKNVAQSAKIRQLTYIVITSVARDDLPDEGASHFAETVIQVRKALPKAGIEILTPDFNGRLDCIEKILKSRPTVFNHNLETCERLSAPIRGRAKYRRSLEVLSQIKARANYPLLTKSGIMVGMGETNEEVLQCIKDIRSSNVDILTIGQYLPPSRKHWDLDRYVNPKQFLEWKKVAQDLGFLAVASAPMVRSSYRAGDLVQDTLKAQNIV